MIYDAGRKSNKRKKNVCLYGLLFNAEFFLDLL